MNWLPHDDPARWPPVATCTRPLPAGRRHGAAAFGGRAVAKPVFDDRGRPAFCTELPDLYPDTAALARATTIGAAAPTAELAADRLAGAPRPLPERLLALLRAQAPGAAIAAREHGAVVRHGSQAWLLECDGLAITVALPAVRRLPPDALAPLCAFAARLNGDVPLCRLEVEAAAARLSVRLPHDRIDCEPLATAIWIAAHSLTALAGSLPPLPTLVDPAFRPLLQLAGAGRSVPAPPTPSEP